MSSDEQLHNPLLKAWRNGTMSAESFFAALFGDSPTEATEIGVDVVEYLDEDVACPPETYRREVSDSTDAESSQTLTLAEEIFGVTYLRGNSSSAPSERDLDLLDYLFADTSSKSPDVHDSSRDLTLAEEILDFTGFQGDSSSAPLEHDPGLDFLDHYFDDTPSISRDVHDSGGGEARPSDQRLRTRDELERYATSGLLVHRALMGGHTIRAHGFGQMPDLAALPNWFAKRATEGDIERLLLIINYFACRPSIEKLTEYLNEHRDLLQPPSDYAHDTLSIYRRGERKKQKRRLANTTAQYLL